MEFITSFSSAPAPYLLAFFLVSISGIAIGPILKWLTCELDNPEQFINKNRGNADWSHLFTIPNGGGQIGLLERNIFLFVALIGWPELILGWLAFKLGAQFQAWGNIVKIPETLKGVNEFEYFKARKMWGDRTYQRFILGTGLNISAVILVYTGLLYFLPD